MTTSLQRERAVKRERVLDAAEALLREGGAGSLTMRALAARADVGHVTPYHLFDSKLGVLRALLARAMADGLAAEREAPQSGDPLIDLLERQQRLIDRIGKDEAYARAALIALDEAAPMVQRGRWLEFVDARSAADLDALVDAGFVRPDAPLGRVRRHLLLGRDGAVRRWLRGLSTLEELRVDDRSVILITLLAVATDAGRERLWRELDALPDDRIPREVPMTMTTPSGASNPRSAETAAAPLITSLSNPVLRDLIAALVRQIGP